MFVFFEIILKWFKKDKGSIIFKEKENWRGDNIRKESILEIWERIDMKEFIFGVENLVKFVEGEEGWRVWGGKWKGMSWYWGRILVVFRN